MFSATPCNQYAIKQEEKTRSGFTIITICCIIDIAVGSKLVGLSASSICYGMLKGPLDILQNALNSNDMGSSWIIVESRHVADGITDIEASAYMGKLEAANTFTIWECDMGIIFSCKSHVSCIG